MKRFARTAVVLAVLTATSLLLLTPSAWAVPSYSRRYGVECSTCHWMWGALKGEGVTFRLSGYRAINGRDLKPVEMDTELSKGLLTIPSALPVSIITGVGVEARSEKREASDGTSNTRTGSTLTVMDASIFLSAPFGKNLSAFIEFPMFESRAWEFTPTGPAQANDHGNGSVHLATESPVFEVAKFWWNNLLPENIAPRDSVNLLAGITHPPLAYAPGKVRLSVNQYLVYERRVLDLISPKAVDSFLPGEVGDGLFRLSEPQGLFEVNGMFVPFDNSANIGKKQFAWCEYHVGVSNGSNSKPDNNTQKDLYLRFITRWWNQSLGVFAYYSADTYGDDIRSNGAIGAGGIIKDNSRAHNSTIRVGPDMTLSLAPFGIPVWLENQFLYNRESDPTGFGKSFAWRGGFHQLNWQISKNTVTYGRYDWINGGRYDDTTAGGITVAKPNEWDIVAGVQHLVLQNLKLVGEYRHHEFKDKASTPHIARLTDDGITLRAMVGF